MQKLCLLWRSSSTLCCMRIDHVPFASVFQRIFKFNSIQLRSTEAAPRFPIFFFACAWVCLWISAYRMKILEFLFLSSFHVPLFTYCLPKLFFPDIFSFFLSFHYARSTLASLVAFAWMSALFIRWNWLVFGVGLSATNDLLFSPQFRNNKNGFEMATATLSQESSSDYWIDPNTTEDIGTHKCVLYSTAHYTCQCSDVLLHICYIFIYIANLNTHKRNKHVVFDILNINYV